ncbi:MAG: hypothetical protein ACK58N_14075, partial [Synechocystis sp.]
DYQGVGGYGAYDAPRSGRGVQSNPPDYRSTAYGDWDQSRVTRQRTYRGGGLGGGNFDQDIPRGGSGGDRRSVRPSSRNDDYEYQERDPTRAEPSRSSSSLGDRRPSSQNGSRYPDRPAKPGRNLPLENGWDDDDDDWF